MTREPRDDRQAGIEIVHRMQAKPKPISRVKHKRRSRWRRLVIWIKSIYLRPARPTPPKDLP